MKTPAINTACSKCGNRFIKGRLPKGAVVKGYGCDVCGHWNDLAARRKRAWKALAPINTLVTRLKKLNASYERLQRKRDRTPQGPGIPPNAAHQKLNAEANKISGNIMHTERCIINAMLRTP